MRTLVTGGCGFLGTHICERFRKEGWEVRSFDNLTKFELDRTGYNTQAAREHNLDFLKKIGVSNIEGDVRALDQLLDASQRMDMIVHAAAQPAITVGLELPHYDLETNTIGTLNAVISAERHRIPLVSCATIHVYGNSLNNRLAEEALRYSCVPPALAESAPILTGDPTPLHISKAAAEQYLLSYARRGRIVGASFRLTGLYGPHQFGGEDHGWLANFAIRNILGKTINIFGTGKQLRDVLYASDAAEAFYRFARKPASGAFNIGGGEASSLSLNEAVRLIEQLTGRRASVEFFPSRPGDLRYFVCDTSKAFKYFNWNSTVSPETGVRRLLDWVEDNKAIFS